MLHQTSNVLGFPLLSLTVFLPLVGALGLALLPRRHDALYLAWGVFVAAVTTVLAGILWLDYDSTWPFIAKSSNFQFADPALGPAAWLPGGMTYQVAVDGIAVVLVLLTALLALLALAFSFGSVRTRVREYVALVLIMETGVLGVFAAMDLFLFYIFWEAALIPMLLLIGIWGGKERLYAAYKFVVYTIAGSSLMLVAIVAAKGLSHATSFHYFDMIHALAPLPGMPVPAGIPLPLSGPIPWIVSALHVDAGLAVLGLRIAFFLAFALAFAVKVPMFPFHTWLPDAHVQAPTAGSVLLAGVLLKMGTFGFIRWAMPMFPDAAYVAGPWLVALALIGIWYGAWVAFAQTDMKSLVAYSSVSHMGLILVAILAIRPVGMAGGALQMINHGISTGALFLLVGMLYDRAHTRDIAAFGGLWSSMPRYSALFLVVTFSSIGLPGTNGFVGEWMSLLGAFQRNPVWGIFAAFGVVFGAAYMLRLVQRVFFGPPSDLSRTMPDLTLRELAILAPLVVLIFWIGLYPRAFLEPIESSGTAIVETMRQGLAEVVAMPGGR
ncbi:MAG: NADH-quinone oxidoreductase subunit M [Ardenticatenales bacterium]